uniref:Ycf54 n=1 Tax=Synarthrophyton chejuense TaxID=2485825 RepID=A0A3G3MFQ3_9FLOR|nr:hypothetical protein [Synarthrophyton chejuense]AYR05652.1 hypothetical protein [Synarthrophyton chejuense]
MIKYYFLVASKDFLLYQEPVEEILRERINHYNNLKKKIDFGVTTNLSFLNDPDLIHIRLQLVKPSIAIISLDSQFINWLKLRIGYVITDSFISSSINLKNSLASFDSISFI